MKKPLALLLLFGLACSNPHNQALPTDLAAMKAAADSPQFKEALEKLPPDERNLVVSYMTRAMIAQAFGADTNGMAKTFGDAITQQRKWAADETAKEAAAKALTEKVAAERAAAVKAMNDVLTVAFKSKRVVPKDYEAQRFSDTIEIVVALQNMSAKTLSGVKGDLVFKDIFGDLIKSAGLKVDSEILVGQTLFWNGSLDINQFVPADVKLAQTAQDKLKVSWEPDTYLFSDGTSMKAPAAAE